MGAPLLLQYFTNSKLDYYFLCLLCRFVSVDLDVESPKDGEQPGQVAETVFRDLICRASFGNLKPVLKPILV